MSLGSRLLWTHTEDGVPMGAGPSLARMPPKWIAVQRKLQDGLPSLWWLPNWLDE